jgi:hypothetical protein
MERTRSSAGLAGTVIVAILAPYFELSMILSENRHPLFGIML